MAVLRGTRLRRSTGLGCREIRKRGGVFQHTDSAPLRDDLLHTAEIYFWPQHVPQRLLGVGGDRGDTRLAGGFGVYDAPEPWGPWTTASFTERWDVGPGDTATSRAAG